MDVIICQAKWKTQLDSVTILTANPCLPFREAFFLAFRLRRSLRVFPRFFRWNRKTEDKLTSATLASHCQVVGRKAHREKFFINRRKNFYIDSLETTLYGTWEPCTHKSNCLIKFQLGVTCCEKIRIDGTTATPRSEIKRNFLSRPENILVSKATLNILSN